MIALDRLEDTHVFFVGYKKITTNDWRILIYKALKSTGEPVIYKTFADTADNDIDGQEQIGRFGAINSNNELVFISLYADKTLHMYKVKGSDATF